MQRALFVAYPDSNVKVAHTLGRYAAMQGCKVDYYVPRQRAHRYGDHFAEFGFTEPYDFGTIEQLLLQKRTDESVEAVFLCLTGPELLPFFKIFNEKYKSATGARPITCTGYWGMTFGNLIGGYLARSGGDIFCVNSRYDYSVLSRAAADLGIPSDNIVHTGLPILDGPHKTQSITREDAMLFAAQPTIPALYFERLYVLERLVSYARGNPSTRVYFKPRHRLNQTTLHEVKYHYELLLRELSEKGPIPDNFILTYEPILDLLRKVGLCLTISSTAAFEALALGCPVGIISDFGLSEGMGTSKFAGSGLLTRFRDISNAWQNSLRQSWRTDHFTCDGRNTERVFKRVCNVVEKQKSSGHTLPLRKLPMAELKADYADFLDRVSGQESHRGGPPPSPVKRFLAQLARRTIVWMFKVASRIKGVDELLKRAYMDVRGDNEKR